MLWGNFYSGGGRRREKFEMKGFVGTNSIHMTSLGLQNDIQRTRIIDVFSLIALYSIELFFTNLIKYPIRYYSSSPPSSRQRAAISRGERARKKSTHRYMRWRRQATKQNGKGRSV